MNKLKSIQTVSLSDHTNFRLNEINKIKNYFESEIKDRDTMVKKLNKCITGFDYTDKSLIVLSATFSGVSIFSHLKVKKYTGLISSALVLSFSLTTTIKKKLLYETKQRKKKHNKLVILGKNKLDCIEMLLS